jgi:amidase
MDQFLQMVQPRARSTTDALALLARLDVWRAAMFAWFKAYDAILCPACAAPAVPHGSSWANPAAYSYTLAFNLTGWPCAVVRAGASAEGLPIGVQIVGKPWREDVVLALARRVESLMGGWQPPAHGISSDQGQFGRGSPKVGVP